MLERVSELQRCCVALVVSRQDEFVMWRRTGYGMRCVALLYYGEIRILEGRCLGEYYGQREGNSDDPEFLRPQTRLRASSPREASGINVCIQGHTTACLTPHPRLDLQSSLQVNLYGSSESAISAVWTHGECDFPLLRGETDAAAAISDVAGNMRMD